MSISYTIEAQLQAPFNLDTILHALNNGNANQISYYDKFLEGINLGWPIPVDEAAQIVWQRHLNEPPCILAWHDNTGFYIYFYKAQETNNLEIMLFPILSILKQGFVNDNYEVDFATYIRILLMLCSSFKITKLEAYYD